MTFVCIALVIFLAYREWSAAQERRQLLQRIQAPRAAVNEFAARPAREPVPVVPVDDDAAHAEARERRLNERVD
jgi:hypothetical protein